MILERSAALRGSREDAFLHAIPAIGEFREIAAIIGVEDIERSVDALAHGQLLPLFLVQIQLLHREKIGVDQARNVDRLEWHSLLHHLVNADHVVATTLVDFPSPGICLAAGEDSQDRHQGDDGRQ